MYCQLVTRIFVFPGTIQKVNDLVAQGNEGRLFAVIHVAGKQFKVTAEDLILIEGYWPPSNGDEINMEKVCGTFSGG